MYAQDYITCLTDMTFLVFLSCRSIADPRKVNWHLHDEKEDECSIAACFIHVQAALMIR